MFEAEEWMIWICVIAVVAVLIFAGVSMYRDSTVRDGLIVNKIFEAEHVMCTTHCGGEPVTCSVSCETIPDKWFVEFIGKDSRGQDRDVRRQITKARYQRLEVGKTFYDVEEIP